jgi:hypothetical protein
LGRRESYLKEIDMETSESNKVNGNWLSDSTLIMQYLSNLFQVNVSIQGHMTNGGIEHWD